ncbi:MAG: hypothetical protein H8E85_00115, partial [Candidatus Marinimicrobia bacterium]|nr:hypothetical protein [Candidatus Neomarinimicrobiota bacterium]
MIELIKSLFYFILFVIALAGNNHPEPPAIPIVQAIYDHEKITIYWDRASEKSIDPLSKYSDFEGYRVFRSTDGGETWGAHWDKIYDYSTPPNQVGWEPWRQYDLRGLRDSSHCIYSDAFYESNPDGEKCYSNSIDIGQIEPDSLIIILNKQKQYLKIDTIFQEINSNGSSLRSSHFIEYIGDFNKTLTQKYSLVVDTIIVDTVYELINTNDISLDSLGQLLKLDGLIFEPDNKPCSDNASNNHHDCLCESSALWTGNGCVKWNGSEYIVASTTGSTWDRTSFYIPILSGDIINKSIKSNSTDSLDRVKVSVPGIEIDTIFYSIVTGDISADSINKLIDIGGVLIDTVLHPIIVGNIDADSIDVLIGMGEDSLKSDYGGYIDTVFHNISTIGCKYGKLCEFDSTCNTENETNGISWVCDTTATYVNGGELGTTTAEATDSLRILNNNSTTSGTGWREYCDGSGCGSGIVDTTYIKKCDWYVLPNSSQSTIYYPDWKVLPNISTSVISVPDWEVINNCTSIINVPDFTVKSSGCYAYGADCAIQPSCWAYGISSSECNDPGSTSNIKIKVPHWKIKSSGVSIPVPDWWVSENSNSKIQIPNYNRNEDVSGYHELALWTNIGSDESSNKGLFRSFTDNHVLDGIEYTYAVTAYDMGLKTYNVSYIDELSEPFYDKNNDGERGKFEYYIDIDESANCNDIIDGIFISDTIWSNANPDHIRGINERGYPSFSTSIYHESFTDYNANGTRDIGEDFIDCGSDEDGNAICENDEGWKETFGNGEWGLRENPTNVISIVPGYKASNRKFTEDSELVVAEATNIGNGNTLSRIVNINDIDTARIIRFEVNAKLDSNAYGNSLGSFATQVPSMYAWEITDEDNTPINTYSITTDDIKGNLIGYTDTDIKSCNKGWRCSCIDDWELGIKTKIYSDGSYIDYNC